MTPEQKQAYEWAKNQDYQSVAARYAKTLASLVDELHKSLEPEVARKIFADIENCLNGTNVLYTSDLEELKKKYIQEREG